MLDRPASPPKGLRILIEPTLHSLGRPHVFFFPAKSPRFSCPGRETPEKMIFIAPHFVLGNSNICTLLLIYAVKLLDKALMT
jgi:hypothetical protein